MKASYAALMANATLTRHRSTWQCRSMRALHFEQVEWSLALIVLIAIGAIAKMKV